MISKKVSPAVHIVAAVSLGIPLSAVTAPTFLSQAQMTATQMCEAGHDPLAEACLATGAKPKLLSTRRYADRKSRLADANARRLAASSLIQK
jgi:hypothetical protein